MIHFRVQKYNSLSSTMDKATQHLLSSYVPEGFAILAQMQTQGKGRMKRTWLSFKGNLHLSFILRPQIEFSQVCQLSFVVSLALLQTLEDFLPSCLIQLKWPNDVLLNSKKIAGILLETNGNDKNIEIVIIGIGCNLIHFPFHNVYPATSLFHETGIKLTPDELLEKFFYYFNKIYKQWLEEGFKNIRFMWLQKAKGIGEVVTLSFSHKTLEGIYKGITSEGFLLITDKDDKERIIHSADLWF